jgi:hypothetical protein
VIEGLLAVTFDFGNTLVPFPAASMGEVVRLTAETAAGIVGCRPEEFVRVWAEERQRQLDENVPQGREADMDVRVVRVIARLRGVPSPGPDRWEDASIAAVCEPGELSAILNAYARAFVAETPVPDTGWRFSRIGPSPSPSSATWTPRAGRLISRRR